MTERNIPLEVIRSTASRGKKKGGKKKNGEVCRACYTSTDIVAKWPYGYRNNGGWDDCGGRRDALCT